MTGDAAASYPKRTPAKEKQATAKAKKTEARETEKKLSAPAIGNIEYRVQIGAFRNKKVTDKRLAARFHVDEQIISEMHEGYFKFMTGTHADYREARQHRERLRKENGIRSAFVVAYNHGKRITVQEALMISKQKWFK